MYHIRQILHSEIKNYIPFKTDDTGIWLEVTYSHNIIAVFQLQEFTKITGNIHLHILNEYRGKGIAKALFDPLINWIKSNTQYKKLIATIPETNIRMRSIVSKLPFRISGIISDAIIIDNTLQNLLIFELNIG